MYWTNKLSSETDLSYFFWSQHFVWDPEYEATTIVYTIPPHQNGCIYLRNERKKNAKNQRINWIQTKFSVLNEWFVLSEEVILLENFVGIFHSVKKLMQSSVNILKMKNVSRNLTKNFYKTQKVFYFLELVLSLHFLSERTGKKENWYLKK